MSTLKTQFNHVKNRISCSVQEFNREKGSVQLLAVSKTWSASHLRELAGLGQTAFGENYLQEALAKIEALVDLNLTWHFIGPIQSNKTRDIAKHFAWVHSIERSKIAQRLSDQRPENMADLNVCIQLNIDNEATKSGIKQAELMSLAQEISNLHNLTLRGLMIIPSVESDPEQQKATFKHAFNLYQQLAKQYPTVDTLSMGMSNDMEIAIENGTTLVRIGSALFGKRSTTKNIADVN